MDPILRLIGDKGENLLVNMSSITCLFEGDQVTIFFCTRGLMMTTHHKPTIELLKSITAGALSGPEQPAPPIDPDLAGHLAMEAAEAERVKKEQEAAVTECAD